MIPWLTIMTLFSPSPGEVTNPKRLPQNPTQHSPRKVLMIVDQWRGLLTGDEGTDGAAHGPHWTRSGASPPARNSPS
jgi:hypothetical protein